MIRKAWTSKGRFSHHGKRWHFDDIVVEPAPSSSRTRLLARRRQRESISRAARDGYNLLLDQIAPTDLIIERVRLPRGMPSDRPALRPDDGRGDARPADRPQRGGAQAAISARSEVLKNIGDLARGPGADRYTTSRTIPTRRARRRAAARHARGDHRAPEATRGGGVENVLFAAPGASVAGFGPSPRRSCRPSTQPMALAQVYAFFERKHGRGLRWLRAGCAASAGRWRWGWARIGHPVVAVGHIDSDIAELETAAAELQLRDRVLSARRRPPATEECDRVVEEARARFGGVEILVNNAGLTFTYIDPARFRRPTVQRFWEVVATRSSRT